MWTRRLGFGLLLLLLCLPLAQALPLSWEELSTEELLQRAASSINELMILNSDLQEKIAKSLEHSKELEKQLETLTTSLAESERMRVDLVNTLKISEEYWKNYGEEVNIKAKTYGIFIGLGFGITLFAVIELLH